MELTGEEIDWRDAKRAEIVRVAAAELGEHGKGSPRVFEYWRTVVPESWSDAQVRQYAATKDWCGGFVLWCYHQAGIATHVRWKDGIGFAGPCRLPQTKDPLPGDLCIRPKNSAGKFVWHHAVVESIQAAAGMGSILSTIDGNQPGVKRRVRPMPKDNMLYYSVEPFLALAIK